MTYRVGWDIETDQEHGRTATYVLRRAKATTPTQMRAYGRPIGKPRTCPACKREHPVGTTCAVAA